MNDCVLFWIFNLHTMLDIKYIYFGLVSTIIQEAVLSVLRVGILKSSNLPMLFFSAHPAIRYRPS